MEKKGKESKVLCLWSILSYFWFFVIGSAIFAYCTPSFSPLRVNLYKYIFALLYLYYHVTFILLYICINILYIYMDV